MGDTAAFSLYASRSYSEPTNLTELSGSYFSVGRRKLTQGTSFGCLRQNKIQPCDAVKKLLAKEICSPVIYTQIFCALKNR